MSSCLPQKPGCCPDVLAKVAAGILANNQPILSHDVWGYSIGWLSDTINKHADVAELVDALDLGSSVLAT